MKGFLEKYLWRILCVAVYACNRLKSNALKTNEIVDDATQSKKKTKNDCQNRTKHSNLLDLFHFNVKHHQ